MTTTPTTPTLLSLDTILDALESIADATSPLLLDENEEQLEDSLEALTPDDRVEVLNAITEFDGIVYECGDSYSEPGYSEPEQPFIFLGDWWVRPDGELAESPLVNVIQTLGGHTQWHDEWTLCNQCSAAIRESADSYSWKRSFVEWNGERYCEGCMEDTDDRAEFIRDQLEENPRAALTLDWDCGELGYVQMAGDFEHGFHRGMDANPTTIASSLEDLGFCRFFFKIDSTSQFSTGFSCWIHRDEDNLPIGIRHRVTQEQSGNYAWSRDELLAGEDGAPVVFDGWEAYQEAVAGPWAHLKLAEPVVLFRDIETDGPSVSEGLKAGLQAATAAMDSLPGLEGEVRYVSVDCSTGTAKASAISAEDFIAGRMGLSGEE